MTHEEIVEKLKFMIVERLNMQISPHDIHEDQPLFASAEGGGGLGLDSIEALEIVVGIEELFGVGVEYSEGVEQRFYSLNTMAEYIEELLGKKT
jgi:acyl carrier protein